MKTAQELRVGNVVMINNTPMVILKSEYSKGGRGASTVKLKMKNLLSNGGTETVYRADDRFEDIILDKKEVSYSYFGDPLYVWMDDEYNQYEVEAEVMEDVLKYLEDGMKAEVVLYNGRPISIELPTILVREVVYTEPAVKVILRQSHETCQTGYRPHRSGSGFRQHRRQDRNRHKNRRIPQPRYVICRSSISLNKRLKNQARL